MAPTGWRVEPRVGAGLEPAAIAQKHIFSPGKKRSYDPPHPPRGHEPGKNAHEGVERDGHPDRPGVRACAVEEGPPGPGPDSLAHPRSKVGKPQNTAKAPADEQVGRAGAQGRRPEAVTKAEGKGIEKKRPGLPIFISQIKTLFLLRFKRPRQEYDDGRTHGGQTSQPVDGGAAAAAQRQGLAAILLPPRPEFYPCPPSLWRYPLSWPGVKGVACGKHRPGEPFSWRLKPASA